MRKRRVGRRRKGVTVKGGVLGDVGGESGETVGEKTRCL